MFFTTTARSDLRVGTKRRRRKAEVMRKLDIHHTHSSFEVFQLPLPPYSKHYKTSSDFFPLSGAPACAAAGTLPSVDCTPYICSPSLTSVKYGAILMLATARWKVGFAGQMHSQHHIHPQLSILDASPFQSPTIGMFSKPQQVGKMPI